MTTEELIRSVARSLGDDCEAAALDVLRDCFRTMHRMDLAPAWQRWVGLEAHRCAWRAIAREARRELQRLRKLPEPLFSKKVHPPTQGAGLGYTASDGTSPGQPGASPNGEGQGPGETARLKPDKL